MKINYLQAQKVIRNIVALLDETKDDPVTFGSRRVCAGGVYKVGAMGALAVLGYIRPLTPGRDLWYSATREQLERLKKDFEQFALSS